MTVDDGRSTAGREVVNLWVPRMPSVPIHQDVLLGLAAAGWGALALQLPRVPKRQPTGLAAGDCALDEPW
jgi:hypothetical protein